jgi:hypothetical protein
MNHLQTLKRASRHVRWVAGLAFAMWSGVSQAQPATSTEKVIAAAAKAASAADSAASSAQSAAAAATSAAKSVEDLKASYLSSEDRFDGDELKLRTRARGFVELDGGSTEVHCAPSSSEVKVFSEKGDDLKLRFLTVAPNVKSPAKPEKLNPDASETERAAAIQAVATRNANLGECASDDPLVRLNIAYRVSKAALVDSVAFRRTGFSFGALVVPFKFRTGVKEIIPSATVAPYVGWRTGWFSSWGLTFTPLVSAGLGLVPVADPATGQSETKSALSFSTGIVMHSSKNDGFQAGLLLGRDYLGRADAALDPGSKKLWLSFYVGYSMSAN